ncbi:hypothetical protein MTO96_014831 [Rhipicephalus appendiculatus]
MEDMTIKNLTLTNTQKVGATLELFEKRDRGRIGHNGASWDDGAWRGSRRLRSHDGGVEAGAQWSSYDVGLPALAAGFVTGALHMWLLQPPYVVRRSAAAAAGACLGTLLVGCFPEPARPWNGDELRPAYGDELPRGPRRPRKAVGLKTFRMDDA